MPTINELGHLVDSKVRIRISAKIERGEMAKNDDDTYKINGIIVHQTNAATAQSTFNSYAHANANGAHFLIDKDGTIYQTASIYKRTNHVGPLRARCLLKNECSPADAKALKTWNPKGEAAREREKDHPDRFPSNLDSIGIEIVGRCIPDNLEDKDSGKCTYEEVTDKQNESLKWLIRELRIMLNISLKEVFRHPVVSYKTETEAATAKW